MWYKFCEFCENRARDTPLRGVYIPHFGQIWVKISILGSYTLAVAPMGVKFGVEEATFGPLLRAKFYPHRCILSPLRGEKPQNRPLSKLNTGRFALRAMLPVKKQTAAVAVAYTERSSVRTRAAGERWRAGAWRWDRTGWWGWTCSRARGGARGSCTWCRCTARRSTRMCRRAAPPVSLHASI